MADYEGEEERMQIVLEDEDGEEHTFDIIGTYYMEGNDYMGLHPTDSDEENEVILIRFREGPEDSVQFEDILDDEEYERAAEAFETLFNGEDDTEREE